MKRIGKILASTLLTLSVISNTCFAAAGYSEEIETNTTVTSMPTDTAKGMFSTRIEGVTPLYNHASNGVGYVNWTISGAEATKGAEGIHLVADGSNEYASLNVNFKPSTTYTIVINLVESTLTGDYLVIDDNLSGRYSYLTNREGLLKVVITTKDDLSSSLLKFLFSSDESNGKKAKFQICGIYEGDQTNNPDINVERPYGITIPSQSYDLVSRGNNIFDKSFFKGSHDALTGIVSYNPGVAISKPIRVKPSTTYARSNMTGYNGYFVYYDTNMSFISATLLTNPITTPVNCDFVRIQFNTNPSNTITDDNIKELNNSVQLIEGTTVPTAYIPHTASTASFTVPKEYPLIELPNGVKNYIDNNGDYIVNVTYHIFDGEEEWTNNGVNSNTDQTEMLFKTSSIVLADGLASQTGMTNTFFLPFQAPYNKSGELISAKSTDGKTYLRISKSRLETNDVAGFKKWLKNNPVIVYYQLATPLTVEDGEQDYKAPSSLQAYPNGDLVIMPVNTETNTYTDKISVQRTSMPIERITKINKIKAGTKTIVDLNKVQIASDGLSFTIEGAAKGDIYTYSYEYPSSKFINPIVKFSTPINREGQVNSTIDALDKQNKQIQYILEQLKMIQSDLDEIKQAIN